MDSELQAVFERLDTGAHRAIISACEEARALRHSYTGTEHILISLLGEQAAPTASVLKSFCVTQDRARAKIQATVGSGNEQLAGEIPFTPRATRALQFALSEAMSRRHERVATADLLLGLVRADDSAAIRILLDLDADPQQIRAELVRRTTDEPGPG